MDKVRLILAKLNLTAEKAQSDVLDATMMLDYTRQLYDALLELEVSTKQSPAGAMPAEDALDDELDSLFREEARNRQAWHRPVEAPKQEALGTVPSPSTMPVSQAESAVETVSPSPSSQPKEEFPAPQPEPTTPSPSAQVHASTPTEDVQEINEELSELFSFSENSSDLSSKLANTPIKDLRTAMSINDRLLYSKILFEGKDEEFNSFLDKLNTSTNFEHARARLTTVINDYGWDSTHRQGIAKSFIRLIRRRFQS